MHHTKLWDANQNTHIVQHSKFPRRVIYSTSYNCVSIKLRGYSEKMFLVVITSLILTVETHFDYFISIKISLMWHRSEIIWLMASSSRKPFLGKKRGLRLYLQMIFSNTLGFMILVSTEQTILCSRQLISKFLHRFLQDVFS